jgi:hypothetical protein
MGTEMTLYAEKRVDNSWEPVPKPVKDRRSGRPCPVQAIDIGQPYELFSLLCGDQIGMQARLVDVPRLFGGRGLPGDLCPLYRKTLPGRRQSERGTGSSWLVLRELVELDWDQPVRKHAYVEERHASWFHLDKPFPPRLSELWTTRGIYHGLIGGPPAGTVRVEWSLPLREFVGCGEWFIEQLSALAAGAELRIIYWFDQ